MVVDKKNYREVLSKLDRVSLAMLFLSSSNRGEGEILSMKLYKTGQVQIFYRDGGMVNVSLYRGRDALSVEEIVACFVNP